jgi:glutamyl-tRNA reductase
VKRTGVVGVSYRTTQADKLARATLPADFSAEDLNELARLAGFAELVYLGTCNRVELYFRTDTVNHNASVLFHLRRSLADLTGGACQLPSDDEIYFYRGTDAIRHLFRVTASLDSMMVGEAQILGQVKQAHEAAHKAGRLNGILDQAFHEAFHLAKRIRTETALSRRPVSLVTLVERKLEDHLSASSAPALILGAGEMAAQSLKLIRAIDPRRRVVIANRTPDRAERLAGDDANAYPIALDSILMAPPAAGLVVAATSSNENLLRHDEIAAIRQQLPSDEPLLLIDLAMPANIEPLEEDIPGVYLVGIEEMRAEAERNRLCRLKELERCDELVEHQITILRRRLLDRSLSPVARDLHAAFDDLASRAVQRSLERDLAHLPEADRQAVERMTRELVKRLVQVPLRGLKGAAWEHSVAILESFCRGLEGNAGRSGNGRDA